MPRGRGIPLLQIAAYVLNLWVESGVSIFATTRSVAVGVLATGALLLVLALVTRRPHLAGAVTLVASALLVSRGALNMLAVGLVLAVAVPFALVLWGRIRRAPLSWPRFAQR